MSEAPGEWSSPITPERAAAASGGLIWVGGRAGETWWCASGPATATVRLMRRSAAGEVVDVLGAGRSVRNRMCGYGGRPYALCDDGSVVFTEHSDQRLYHDSRPLTPGDPTTWYADPTVRGAEVWCLRETTAPGGGDPVPRTSRDIVAVPLDGSGADDPGAIRTVARAHHFLSGVRISPDGRRLAWIGWDHPRMSWDGTDLMVADLVDGVAVDARRVLGGPDVSVPQAEWDGNDTLYAMADPDGWWNLHRIELPTVPDRATLGGPTPPDVARSEKVACVLPMPEECAGALWRVGASWFALAGGRVVLHHGVGAQRLAVWDPGSGELRDLAPGWTDFGTSVWADGEHAVICAGSARERFAVLRVPLDGGEPIRCTPPTNDPWLSTAQRRVADGVHYVYYPPHNPSHAPPQGPPLIVTVHGGPTGRTNATPSVELSLFTSRGFAVASVDYGGSTGYGRAYRERLRHLWGVVDVADCVTVVRALANAGEVDATRVAIRGDSAGGWTTLAALAHSDVFCAGAVYYPIADATRWSGEHTHDFEARYMDGLVRPADRERISPLHNADRITSPIVMLQGAEDTICPPEHAESIIDAVRQRGLWHRLLIFDGEGHGFRLASSVTASLLAELNLYSYSMHIDIAGRG
ncbi:MAG TPA: prolyl oligopeptidase family serine peptidase [Jatrophihabitantaceae bacterium]